MARALQQHHRVQELEVVVTSRDEACEVLRSKRRCADLSFVVSIGDLDDPTPPGLDDIERKVRLLFNDTGGEDGATVADVEQLIEFARIIATTPGRVLAHCHAGISRSAAAAYIIYAVALGEGREQEALDRVFLQRPLASPNQRMVAIADGLLDRNGAMIDALENRY